MAKVETKSAFRAMLDVRRTELPFALLMCSYFFLVITTFWILKPLKKALFIGFYDKAGVELMGVQLVAAQAELIAKVMNMLVAAAAVVAFTLLSRRLVRQQLTHVFTVFFVAGFGLYALASREPGNFVVWSFYLFGDLYSTLMVATFFAFLNDSVSPDVARRLYGPIVLGGVLGGSFGALFVAVWTSRFGPPIWMGICAAIGVVIAVLAAIAGRLVQTGRVGRAKEAHEVRERPPQAKGSAAFEGARLVFRSPYLLSIALIVGLYEIVSTMLDFQFTATIAHYRDGQALGQQFATVFAITAVASLVVQLFFTSFTMSRFRLTVALLVTPMAIVLGSSVFLLFPLLWTGSLLNTWDNATAYSMNQSAREALYTPTSRDEKYKAKAFIDMFVQRFAKSIAVGVSLGATLLFTDFSTVRWLSIVAIGLVGVWIVAARYAGRRFHDLSGEGDVATSATTRGDAAPGSPELVEHGLHVRDGVVDLRR
jgi:AAA family ATP:ADP antiporter